MRTIPFLLVLSCAGGGSVGIPSETSETSETNPADVDTDTDTDADTDPWTGWGACTEASDCDDGLDCSDNQCQDGRCITVPLADCNWPATDPDDAERLAVESPFLEAQLSGLDFDPALLRLWAVRRDWVVRLVDDGGGGWMVDTVDGSPAIWPVDGDKEGITLFDPARPDSVLLVTDGDDTIEEWDFSAEDGVRVRTFDTEPFIQGGQNFDGTEGITFVPDASLNAWNFTDDGGTPVVSANGMGGLTFVAHQTGGAVYVFDLDPDSGDVDLVGRYLTDRDESAGLEFDASTGRLYIFHGDVYNDLEVARLSTSTAGQARKFDTEYVWNYPSGLNSEGVAVAPVDTCVAGGRSLWIASDDAGARSLQWYRDWVCF